MMIEIKRVELRSRGSSFTSNLGPFKDLGEASPSRDGGGEAGGLIMDDIRSAYLWVVILMVIVVGGNIDVTLQFRVRECWC